MDRTELIELYRRVRAATEALARPLTAEDQVVQTMPDVSPTKWHRAHTSWFFETFVLERLDEAYRPFDDRYAVLFNSYYKGVGRAHPRPERGLLSRPTVAEITDYRGHVDEAMERALETASAEALAPFLFPIELGLNHEEQHQELLLTDILHAFSVNPLRPAYAEVATPPATGVPPMRFLPFEGGLVEVGCEGPGFAYDNERPRHRTFLEAFELADRLVTCDEYLEFVMDGGYSRPELWLSDGFSVIEEERIDGPLYWERHGEDVRVMTLSGMRALEPSEPVCHVSYYEADAYARWAGARLPREEEWEAAAGGAAVEGNLAESGLFHPAPAGTFAVEGAGQLIGDVWEWTASPYSAYPGFIPFEGDLGEYNGKFMCNQLVLRGGSCVTPRRHIRTTYRNFFPPSARWQFSGIRLAR